MTDGWHDVRASLKSTYALCRDLPVAERDELKRAIAAIDLALSTFE